MGTRGYGGRDCSDWPFGAGRGRVRETKEKEILKTVKNMWAFNPGLTVFTIVMWVGLLVPLWQIWVLPVAFGYPWYTIVGNLVVTGFYFASIWAVADLANN